MFEITRPIYSNSEKKIGNRMFFLLVPGGFSYISDKSQQLEFNLEKDTGI